MQNEFNMWAGSLHSYEVYKAALLMANTPKALAYDDAQDNGEQPRHRLLTASGNVGVIAIKGSLIEGTAGYMTYYGVTGYDDVRNALVAAVSNPNMGSILLDIGSGGGHVAGVHELAQLIARIDKVKPVITYTGSGMQSAALWAGISARKVYAAETAEVGSIGILMVHKDYSKQLADNGVKVTVIKAGVHKAVGNPYEELSEKDKTAMEARAQSMYDIFLPWVAKARAVNDKTADSKFGQGQVFIGKEAKAAGLVDEVGSFEDAYMAASKLAGKSKTVPTQRAGGFGATNLQASPTAARAKAALLSNNPATAKETLMATKPLTTEQIAALAAAGVPFEADANAGDDAAAQAQALADAQAQAAAAGQGKPETKPEVKPVAQADSALVVLGNMLAEANAKVGALTADKTELEAKLKTSAAEAAAFIGIARASAKTMGLHFGVKGETVDAMASADLLTEHSRLAEQFKAKFKTGGVAATGEASKDSVKTEVPLSFRIAAKQFSNQAK